MSTSKVSSSFINRNCQEDEEDDSKKYSTNLPFESAKSHTREPRATDDELSAEIERMQKVARLTTGIAIQLDLISGTLKPEDLISELLHLGSVTPTQIIAMNATNVQSAIADLKTLPKRLAKTEEFVTKLEEQLRIWKLVKNGGDGTQWLGKNEFLAEMKLVSDDKIGMDVTVKFGALISSWIHEYGKLTDPNLSNTDAKMRVNDLRTATERINSTIPQLVEAAKTNIKLPNMESAEEGLEPVSSLLASVQYSLAAWNKVWQVAGENTIFDSEMNNLAMISKVSKSLLDSSTHLAINVIQTRMSHSKSTTSKFPGFPKGYNDVNALFSDLNNPWIKTFVNSDAVSTALSLLKELGPTFKAADTALGMPNDFQFLEEISGVLMIPTDTTRMERAFEKFSDCKRLLTGVPIVDTTSIDKFVKSAKDLDGMIQKFNENVKAFASFMNTEELRNLLNGVVELCTTDDDVTKMKQIVDALKASKQLKNLNEKLVASEPFRGDVLKNPKTQAEQILNNEAVVGNFTDGLDSLKTLFACYFKLNDEQETLVENGIAVSKNLRDPNRDSAVLDVGETAINNLMNGGSNLKKLIGEIEKVKDQSTPASDALETLTDHQKHSLIIGSATRQVSAMLIALEKKQDAIMIFRNQGIVRKEMSNVINPEDMRNLKAVIQLGSSLEQMYLKLEDWRDGLNATSSTDLASHSELFSSAILVPAITDDLGDMSKSVEVLISKISDPGDKAKLSAVKSALDSLATINLNFANYTAQLNQTKESLAALDLFFANYKPIFSVTVAPNSNGGSAGPGQLELPNAATELTIVPSNMLDLAVCGAVGVGLIAIGTIGAIWYCKKRFFVAKLVPVRLPVIPDLEEQPTQPIDALPLCTQEFAQRYIADFMNRHEIAYDQVTKELLSRQEKKKKKGGEKKKKKQEDDKYKPIQYMCKHVIEGVKKLDKPDDWKLPLAHSEETRKVVPLENSTRVIIDNRREQFRNTYIHANVITFPNGLKMILTQAPMDAHTVGRSHRKKNIEKFWSMAKQYQSRSIVMLNQTINEHCHPYFPVEEGATLQFLSLKLTCLQRWDTINKGIGNVMKETRLLLVEFEDDVPFTVFHYHHCDFRTGTAPNEFATIIEILKSVRTDTTPVIVHCNDGISRSACFALIELEYQTLCRGESNIVGNLISLRAQRSSSLNNPLQLAFCMATVVVMASEWLLKPDEEIPKFYISYWNHESMKSDRVLSEPTMRNHRLATGAEDVELGEEAVEEEDVVIPSRMMFKISQILHSARISVGWTRPLPPETRAVMEFMNKKTDLKDCKLEPFWLVDKAGDMV